MPCGSKKKPKPKPKPKLYALLIVAVALSVGCVSGFSPTTGGKLADWDNYASTAKLGISLFEGYTDIVCADQPTADISGSRCQKYRHYIHIARLSIMTMENIIDEWSSDPNPDNGKYVDRLNVERMKYEDSEETLDRMKRVDVGES